MIVNDISLTCDKTIKSRLVVNSRRSRCHHHPAVLKIDREWGYYSKNCLFFVISSPRKDMI